MTFRKVETIFRAEAPHWVGNGFRVWQYFPRFAGKDFMDRFSPFLLMDYNRPIEFNGTNAMTGVGPHPHRGFETVTFAFEGSVEHGDNKGNSGVINPGDIQWMTAGKGILHKEYHEREYAKHDRLFHMIQLWVNLPAKDKMTKPRYQGITKDEMGINKGDGYEIIVYSGEVLGTKGPAKTFSPINIYKISLKKDAEIEIKEPENFNTGFLMIRGGVILNEEKDIDETYFVLFENDGNAFKLKAKEDAEIFVLSGEPLNEPIAAAGPFVMNTKEEIMEANKDYMEGKFGTEDF